jgi:cytochrome oxidase Cu insertion factor (SCO1/SenC/PrrC family)
VRLIVVTLDPWRDTPDRLPTLATHWGLQSGDGLLSGSIAEVQATLDTLGVGRTRSQTTGDIEHGGTVMLLKGGKVVWRLDGGWGRVRELLSRS